MQKWKRPVIGLPPCCAKRADESVLPRRRCAQNRCEYCYAPELVFNELFEVEHIIPVSQGGPDDEANLALACHICNKYKSNFQTGTDAEIQTIVRLFHPRQDNWGQHFYYDDASGELHGLTPEGRASVSRLQMNRPVQISARRLWIQLDLFP